MSCPPSETLSQGGWGSEKSAQIFLLSTQFWKEPGVVCPSGTLGKDLGSLPQVVTLIKPAHGYHSEGPWHLQQPNLRLPDSATACGAPCSRGRADRPSWGPAVALRPWESGLGFSLLLRWCRQWACGRHGQFAVSDGGGGGSPGGPRGHRCVLCSFHCLLAPLPSPCWGE